jgi:hypothetical protein
MQFNISMLGAVKYLGVILIDVSEKNFERYGRRD